MHIAVNEECFTSQISFLVDVYVTEWVWLVNRGAYSSQTPDLLVVWPGTFVYWVCQVNRGAYFSQTLSPTCSVTRDLCLVGVAGQQGSLLLPDISPYM
jgi:hypothetical protein